MALERSPLTIAFLEDHRQLMRGLNRLRETLERGDVSAAVEMAKQIDRTVGAHIEFEEEVLYPKVAESETREFVRQLYDEHHPGLRAVEHLRNRSAEKALAPDEQARLVADIRTMVEHAASCGTLLSHLTALDSDRQSVILERLMELRDQGHRWSALPVRYDPPALSGDEPGETRQQSA